MSELLCILCEKKVEPFNDAGLLYEEAGYVSPLQGPQHLFYASSCPGTPDLSQYFDGQPRPGDHWYPLDIKEMKHIREAYKRLLKKSHQCKSL